MLRYRTMQYNNRAILAMIASAINPLNPDVRKHIYFRQDFAEPEATPDRNALIAYMADGRQFQISVEEVL